MPIPFRDADEVAELGAAGYLKIDVSANIKDIHAALFFINARGEPLEFAFNRIEIPNPFLWRQDDIRRHALRKLATSLFEACSKVPQFVLCLADEVYHDLFWKEIQLSVPVCRVGSLAQAVPHSKLEIGDVLGEPESMQLFWFPGKPAEQSLEQRLLTRLIVGGLLTEPFQRALTGLREVYSEEEQSVS